MDLNPGYLLVTFYLIIAGNFMAPLFSCKLQTLIENNMIMRHIIGLMTFIFFVGLTNIDNAGFFNVIGYSALLYMLFIASMRMDIRLWIPMFGVAVVLFLLGTYTRTEKDAMDEAAKERVEKLRRVLTFGLVGLVVVGMLAYMGAKKIEYGAAFNIYDFVLGTPKCRKLSPSLTIMEELRGLTKLLPPTQK